MQTHRCDRCGKESKEIIDLRLVNQNKLIENEEKEERMFSLFSPSQKYETQNLELCFDCTKSLLHWAGHQENKFALKEIKK